LKRPLSQKLQLYAKVLNIVTFTLDGNYFIEAALQTEFVPSGRGLLQIFGRIT